MSDALLDAFIRHLRVERGISRNTELSYGYQLKGYLAFLAARGKGPLSAGRDDVLAYLEVKKNGALRSASIFAAAAAIRQFHRFLHGSGHVVDDPTHGMRLPKLKQRLPEPLSLAEMRRLLASCQGTKYRLARMYSMVDLMYATGMRVSELTGLRMGHLRLNEGWVRILGKGGKERLVPIGPRAVRVLRRFLAARSARFPLSSDVVFLSCRGRRLGRGDFWRDLRSSARRAGIGRGVAPHQVRHSYATHLLAGGADLRVLQELLGHRSVTTTQRYAHVTPAVMRDACRKAHPRY